MNGERDKSLKMVENIGLNLGAEQKKLSSDSLMKVVMQTWLPIGDSLLDMIVHHLPSPVIAQKYRVENLYEGDMQDEVCL